MATPRKNTNKSVAKSEPKANPVVQEDEVAAEQGMRPVQFSEPVPTEPVDLPADDSESEEVTPILYADSLVRNNEYARNSRSVRAVQEALVRLGQWEASVDPAGYWGSYTQNAAVAVTGEEDPVAAARSLGFTVI